jgi:hypothetical protein
MRIHWPLVILIGVFLAPAIGAGYLLFFGHKINFNSSQYGTLIQNPPNIGLVTADQKWHIVYVAPEVCNDYCEQQQLKLHKVHTALGADTHRVGIAVRNKQHLPEGIATNSILITNPRGLYIMHYEANSDHMGLLKDIRRLLKYSHAPNSK